MTTHCYVTDVIALALIYYTHSLLGACLDIIYPTSAKQLLVVFSSSTAIPLLVVAAPEELYKNVDCFRLHIIPIA